MIYRTGCHSRGSQVAYPFRCGCLRYTWKKLKNNALTVMEPVSTPSPLADSVTIYAKTTVLCSPDSSMDTQFPALVEDSVLYNM
jgi:hypothetical protein